MVAHLKPLRLDFESGDLSFWTAKGEAFANQPLRGDRLKASRVRPGLVPLGGDYWDGPYPVGHQGEFYRVFEATGSDSELMRRVIFNVVAAGLTNQSARIRIVDNSTTQHINVDDFNFSPDRPQVTPLAEGGGD